MRATRLLKWFKDQRFKDSVQRDERIHRPLNGIKEGEEKIKNT